MVSLFVGAWVIADFLDHHWEDLAVGARLAVLVLHEPPGPQIFQG